MSNLDDTQTTYQHHLPPPPQFYGQQNAGAPQKNFIVQISKAPFNTGDQQTNAVLSSAREKLAKAFDSSLEHPSKMTEWSQAGFSPEEIAVATKFAQEQAVISQQSGNQAAFTQQSGPRDAPGYHNGPHRPNGYNHGYGHGYGYGGRPIWGTPWGISPFLGVGVRAGPVVVGTGVPYGYPPGYVPPSGYGYY